MQKLWGCGGTTAQRVLLYGRCEASSRGWQKLRGGFHTAEGLPQRWKVAISSKSWSFHLAAQSGSRKYGRTGSWPSRWLAGWLDIRISGYQDTRQPYYRERHTQRSPCRQRIHHPAETKQPDGKTGKAHASKTPAA